MQITLKHRNKDYQADLSAGIDCSSTYGLPEAEPRAWQAPPVRMEPVKAGDWVGEVKQGAAVNFFDVHLNPHGNGTHTECVGHISPERQSINAFLPEFHCLVYFLRQQPNAHKQITLESVREKNLEFDFEALAIAAPVEFPQDFSGSKPPFFEPALLEFLREKGVKHFLTNLPSVDPEEDGGALAAHKAFWNYPTAPKMDNSITELAHFPPELKEGLYFMNLQVAPLHNDAAPSRPVFFPLEQF